MSALVMSLGLAALSALAGASAPLPSGDFAIVGARVEVGDGTVVENATVVVVGGQISEVVPGGGPAPSGFAVVDGKGKVLTPGLFETRTQLGVFEVGMEDDTVDAELQAGDMRPAFRVADAFNPASTRIPIERKGGVTHALVIPYGGQIAGQAFLFTLEGWTDGKPAEALPLPGAPDPFAPVAMVGGLTPQMAGNSKGGVWLRLRTAVLDTLLYKRSKAAYEKGELRPLSLARHDLEAMIPVVDGKLPLVLAVDRAADIAATLRFVDEMKAAGARLQLVIAGGADAWRLAGVLAERKIPVILTPSMQTPHDFDALHARDDAAAILHKAGVPLILSTHNWDNNVRRLRQEAGIAVSWGLPREAALAALTSTPAAVFGLDDLGTVADGKRANLVLWDGDPLENSTLPVALWIDGKPQSLGSRQMDLAKKYGAGTIKR